MAEKLTMNETIKKREEVDYKNAEMPIEKRVEDLLGRMTLKEKVAQMVGVWEQKKEIFLDEEGKFDHEKISKKLKDGLGQVGRLSDTNGGLSPVEMAEFANMLQKYFVEETRLGIPVIIHEECLHGLVANESTSYPQPIGLASTFNPGLIEEMYSAVAEDARKRGAHQALCPVVDVVRDPRWGRVEETFGEDPYLIGEMGKAAVRGFQGISGDFEDKRRVIATLKHFAAHGQPESGSNCGPANYSERVLRDVFLAPFKEVMEETKPLSVMASYNEIDGLPSHANKWLLRKVLREEWKYEGMVVSDYYAITELNEREITVSHGVAKDKKEAAYLAAMAGVNIELPEIDCYPHIEELVETGKIEEKVVDELVRPMLRIKFQLGLFEDPYVDPMLIQNEVKLEEDKKIALRAAEETITMLKNEGKLLPLNREKIKRVAVIGPNADRVLLGGYSGKPAEYTTVLQGIKDKVGDRIEVSYSEGCKITIGGSWNEDPVVASDPEEDRRLIKEAVGVAEKSDVVILVLGGNEQTSREAWSKSHLGDRTSLDLVGMQNELAAEVLKTGKPVVVLLFNGRPNSINFISENVPSILECWYLGQEAGKAVAEVLFGDVNPSGKLPISIPRSVGHIPCHYNHKPSSRRGYLFDDITPLYAFGYGLSYTEFKISNMRLKDEKIPKGSTTTVSVDVENVGEREGKEVVQLYIRDKVSSVTRPVKELKGFKKVELEAGEKKTITFNITGKELSYTNVEMENKVEAGEFEIMIGSSSKEEDLRKVVLEVE